MTKNVFGKISDGSVAVVDRVTYHTTLIEDYKPAFSTLLKQELAEWLFQRKIREKNTSQLMISWF